MNNLLPCLAILGIALTFAAPDIRGAAAPRRPNVIVIVTDDQRYDALGVVQREQGASARFPFFETPNLDRLAAGGARFRNAFVVHSLCSPSRATMLSGRPTHAHGIRDNRTPFHSEETWPAALRSAGYRTAYFGKWHMGRQADRPGFTDTFTFVDQGEYTRCRFLQNGEWQETNGWVDDVTTEHAIEYVRRHRDAAFAMYIGYKSPHDPRQPPPRHLNDYAGVEIREPVNYRAAPPFRPHAADKPWNPRVQDRLNYFRCIEGVDDNIGRLLEALEAAGIADDTVILFAGDNGYYLGEHGLGDKRSAYDESMRIPLLMRYPRRVKPGTVVDALALNLDFAATIMDLTGVTSPWRFDGCCLVPVAEGRQPADWRRDFLYENYQDPEYPDVTFDIFGVRTETAKLVTYPGHPDWTQVFDLKADPLELHNLAGDPAAAALTAGLEKRLAELRPDRAATSR